MLTIAGGIILAVVIGVLLIAFLQNIIDISLLLIGWGLAIGIFYILIKFLVYDFQQTIVVIAVIGIPLAVIYLYEKKKDKDASIKNKELLDNNQKTENQNNIEEEKKSTLIRQLSINELVLKIKENIGYMLLDAEEDSNKNRLKIIDVLDFQIKLEFFYKNEKFNMSYKKNSEGIFADFSINSYLKLSIDEIFNLQNSIENFYYNQMQNEINEGVKSKSVNKNFFEDIKKIKSSENNQSYIYIYQHLITEEGIYASEPTQCKDRIIAEVSENLSDMRMNIKVDYLNIATISMKKWNELRENGKIKFASEIDNSADLSN